MIEKYNKCANSHKSLNKCFIFAAWILQEHIYHGIKSVGGGPLSQNYTRLKTFFGTATNSLNAYFCCQSFTFTLNKLIYFNVEAMFSQLILMKNYYIADDVNLLLQKCIFCIIQQN